MKTPTARDINIVQMLADKYGDEGTRLACINARQGDFNALGAVADALASILADPAARLDYARRAALLAHLGDVNAEIEDIGTSYGANRFAAEGKEFFVYTDGEADDHAHERIAEDVWAFPTSFIMSHVPSLHALEGRAYDTAAYALKKLQQELCERANPLLRALIPDLDTFTKDALAADGRGHFLNTYDGKEHEKIVEIDGPAGPASPDGCVRFVMCVYRVD